MSRTFGFSFFVCKTVKKLEKYFLDFPQKIKIKELSQFFAFEKNFLFPNKAGQLMLYKYVSYVEVRTEQKNIAFLYSKDDFSSHLYRKCISLGSDKITTCVPRLQDVLFMEKCPRHFPFVQFSSNFS